MIVTFTKSDCIAILEKWAREAVPNLYHSGAKVEIDVVCNDGEEVVRCMILAEGESLPITFYRSIFSREFNVLFPGLEWGKREFCWENDELVLDFKIKASSDARENSCRVGRGITKTPGVCGGVACISRTRITVWVLEYLLQAGLSTDMLLAEYPSLTTDDLRNAWVYVAENKQEIGDDLLNNDDPDFVNPQFKVEGSGRTLFP